MNRRSFIKAALAFAAAALAKHKPALPPDLFVPGDGPWQDGHGGTWYLALENIEAGHAVELVGKDQVRPHTSVGNFPIPAQRLNTGVAVTSAARGDLVQVWFQGFAEVLAELVAELMPELNEQFRSWRPLLTAVGRR